MADLSDLHRALTGAGLSSELCTGPEEPHDHLAVTFGAEGLKDELVLRINRMEHAEDLLDIWQMIVVLPVKGVSATTFSGVLAALHDLNAALLIGKLLPAHDDRMVYYQYMHLAPPGDSATLSSPEVVRIVIELLQALAPGLCAVLANPEIPSAELAAIDDATDALEQALAELVADVVRDDPGQ